MSGFAPGKKLPGIGVDATRRRSADPCDLQFRIDLVGVRTDVERVRRGDVLEVQLRRRDSVRSVVCTDNGRVVGTLAAFQGLAQLINCLDRGNRYVAHVEAVSRTQCAVLVLRETK